MGNRHEPHSKGLTRISTGQSRVKFELFLRNFDARGAQTSTGSVWKAMKALDLRPILKKIRLQERDLASGNFLATEMDPKSSKLLLE